MCLRKQKRVTGLYLIGIVTCVKSPSMQSDGGGGPLQPDIECFRRFVIGGVMRISVRDVVL